jgi:hypothetical protein
MPHRFPLRSARPGTLLPLLLAGFLALAATPVRAETYYVDQAAGSDWLNKGTSRSSPWASIGKAAGRMRPGDTCIVLPGDYDERVRVTASGAPDSPIAYQAEGAVSMRGFTVKASHIRIDGFDISTPENDEQDGAGVFVRGRSVEVLRNTIHDTCRVGIVFASYDDPDGPATADCRAAGNSVTRAGLAGIEVYGRNNTVEDNDVSHTLQHPPTWRNPPSWADADGMRFFGHGHVIRNNRIHDITLRDPGNVSPHIDCFQTWGPAYDITFEGNRCTVEDGNMQGWMVEAKRQPLRNLRLVGNVVWAYRPANIWDCPGNVIAGNTFAYSNSGTHAVELHRSPGSTVRNNIFYDIARPYLFIDDTEGCRIGNNLVFNRTGGRPAGIPYPGDKWGVDPRFVDPAARDFRLRPDSPARNGAVPIPGLALRHIGAPVGPD